MTWTLDRRAPVPAWRASAADPACVLAFSTRVGGITPPPRDSLDLGCSEEDPPAAVRENRRRFLASLDLDPTRLVTAGQVHGSVLRSACLAGHIPECDALLTRVPGLALAVATADCMSLLYAAPGTAAAAHAGWRGAAAGLPAQVLRSLCEVADVPPDAVHVVLGPCIRPCCYRVGDDVARLFPPSTVHRRPEGLHLDLPAAARLQLVEAGLPPGAFEDLGVCTSCERSLCYSYRRDGGDTGRLWGLAALRAP